jgi:hypothetical protein
LQAREKRATIIVARLSIPFWDFPREELEPGAAFSIGIAGFERIPRRRWRAKRFGGGEDVKDSSASRAMVYRMIAASKRR